MEGAALTALAIHPLDYRGLVRADYRCVSCVGPLVLKVRADELVWRCLACRTWYREPRVT